MQLARHSFLGSGLSRPLSGVSILHPSATANQTPESISVADRICQESSLPFCFSIGPAQLLDSDCDDEGGLLRPPRWVAGLALDGVFQRLQSKRVAQSRGFLHRLRRPGSHLGVTLALVRGDVVFLLKLLAAEVAGELVEGVRVVLLHVPVEGGFLAAGEPTDLTPASNIQEKGW